MSRTNGFAAFVFLALALVPVPAALATPCQSAAECPNGYSCIRTAPNDTNGTCVENVCGSDIECNDGTFCNGVERCAPRDPARDARGCIPATSGSCDPGQRCDEEGDRCLGNCPVPFDSDGDGVNTIACGGTDCDDDDPNRFPGKREVCDLREPNHDEDCDPSTFGARDLDRDGHDEAVCCNRYSSSETRCGNDCDDQDEGVHPGNPEVCNGVDDNCDRVVDEGVMVALYPDQDLDGYGSPTQTIQGCPGKIPGYSLTANDCDDSNPALKPGAMLCQLLDGETFSFICNSQGGLSQGECPPGQACSPEPNGTGHCVPL